jgi:glycosyltransferase involved in cell wall biosynthesis
VRPRRSLVVFHVGQTSGPSRSLEGPVAWLAAGGEVDVVVPEPGAVADTYSQICRVGVFAYEALTAQGGVVGHLRRTAGLRRDVRHFRALIARSRPELVIAVTAMLPAVVIAARMEGVPVLVYAGEHFGDAYAKRQLRGLASAALLRFIARAASGVLACSEPVAAQYRRLGASVKTMLPPVVAGPALGPILGEAAARADLGVDSGAPCVVALGSISAGRGQDVLIRAVAELRDRYPSIRCLFFGTPHTREQDQLYAVAAKEMIGTLGLDSAVSFLGAIDDPARAFAAADVVVNPARIEAFGRVPFEAALAGVPSVVTRVGGVGHYLRDGENALVVEPDDPSAMAAAIARLLDDPELGRRLAAAAHEFADAELGPERSVETMESMLAAIPAS